MSDPRSLMGGHPLAPRWALELIAAIVPPARVKLAPHHIGPLESLLYRAFMLYNEPPGRFEDRARAAFKVLEDGFDKDPAGVGKVLGETMAHLEALQQTEHNLHVDAWAVPKEDPDRKFRNVLALYQFTYERYYRTLAAPFVVADALARGSASAQDAVGADGRVSLPIIAELEAGRGISTQALTNGLDNHLRNSVAHSHFDILGDDLVRMWDQRPNGKTSWGPHEFSYWDLRQRVYALSTTCIVLATTLVLFDIAYGRTMFERGWLKPALTHRRTDVLKAGLEDMAQLHGFTVAQVNQKEDHTTIILRVLGVELPDQESHITEGGESSSRQYKQAVRTRYGPAWKQVYGFLQTTFDLHGAYEMLELRLLDASGASSLGRLRASVAHRETMTRGEDPVPLREQVEEDTLSDVEIPVVFKGSPKRIL
jgi:hypothetical protein